MRAPPSASSPTLRPPLLNSHSADAFAASFAAEQQAITDASRQAALEREWACERAAAARAMERERAFRALSAGLNPRPSERPAPPLPPADVRVRATTRRKARPLLPCTTEVTRSLRSNAAPSKYHSASVARKLELEATAPPGTARTLSAAERASSSPPVAPLMQRPNAVSPIVPSPAQAPLPVPTQPPAVAVPRRSSRHASQPRAEVAGFGLAVTGSAAPVALSADRGVSRRVVLSQ